MIGARAVRNAWAQEDSIAQVEATPNVLDLIIQNPGLATIVATIAAAIISGIFPIFGAVLQRSRENTRIYLIDKKIDILLKISQLPDDLNKKYNKDGLIKELVEDIDRDFMEDTARLIKRQSELHKREDVVSRWKQRNVFLRCITVPIPERWWGWIGFCWFYLMIFMSIVIIIPAIDLFMDDGTMVLLFLPLIYYLMSWVGRLAVFKSFPE